MIAPVGVVAAALFGACLVLPSASNAEPVSMISQGTLVVIRAFDGGLVFGSDTRQTIDYNVYCDEAEKIIQPDAPGHFLLAVTGRRGFYPPHVQQLIDPCRYVRETVREFDFGMVAKKWIEQNVRDADLEVFDAASFANHVQQHLVAYLIAHPERNPRVNGDRFDTAFVLASYDPVKSVAYVRAINLIVGDSAIKLDDAGIARIGLDGEADVFVFGEADYLNKEVMPIIGSFPISDSTRSQLGGYPKLSFTKVRDTTRQNAVDMVSDLIRSAADHTRTKVANSGIGGRLDVRLITSADAIERVEAK